MSDRDHNNIIRNQETLKRRAWVDRALQGARRRLEAGDHQPAAGRRAGARPRLYVVPTGRGR